MNTTEKNKLIAEFMGALWNIHSNKYGIGNAEFITIGEKTNVVKALNHYKLEELSYHSNWNWLMQVVEKIESLHPINSFTVSATICYLNIHDKYKNELIQFKTNEETKIEAVYNACVTFIKWYNENKI